MAELVLTEREGRGRRRDDEPSRTAERARRRADRARRRRARGGGRATPRCAASCSAGGEKAFAAGADIGEMARLPPWTCTRYATGSTAWDPIENVRTPIVAAVSGFCLGGGCELAMACDLIVVVATAKFGQPETGLGIIPGAGGTQRLTRAVGKALAMDMILTGRFLSAARRSRRARRARRRARLARRGEAVANAIAAKAPIAARLAKEPSTTRSRRRSPRGRLRAARSTSPSRPRMRARGCTRSWRSVSRDFKGR